ncbi:DUF6493 family protein [Nonomuraea lactucae]|uniref:DUF7824 domain-containing protein n=1 Tax=Nonomuraea lactucae TaxID=2249762 RepID=UPI000DE475E8|nr:DUF6493 family protein [Nonomuraea lactucae]
MNTWESVRKVITRCDAGEVTEMVVGLDDEQRREVARELPGHIGLARKAAEMLYERRQREAHEAQERDRKEFVRAAMAGGANPERAAEMWWMGGHNHHEYWVDWREREKWIEPMRIAGAGTLGGPAAVATWLYRRDFTRWQATDIDPLLRVIAARPPEWQADLAVRLALRLRGTRTQARDDSVPLALALLRRTEAIPPEHEPLVAAWVSTPPDLGRDPLAGHLLPKIFDAEGVGRALRDDRLEAPEWAAEQSSWLRALRDHVATGKVDREMLVDGCVRRFLRGGSAADLRFFVRLHDLLDPAPSRERSRDYLRLLPTAPGPVAELALKQLRGTGGLSGEEVNEALAALLFRAEGKLVRAGLSWLDQTAREEGGDLDHLAPALASAFLCDSVDVQERTVRLAVKHASRFTPIGAEAVREAAGLLPPDLAARLSQVYGGAAPEPVEDDFQPAPLPAFDVPAREPFPGTGDSRGVLGFERWLDAFVRDPSAVKPPGVASDLYGRRHWPELSQWKQAMWREAAHPGQEPPIPEPERPHVHAHHSVSVRTTEGDFSDAFGRLPADVRANIVASLGEGGAPLGNLENVDEGPPLPGEILDISLFSTGNWGPAVTRRDERRDRLPRRHSVSVPHWVLLSRYAEILAALKAGTLPPYLLATPTLTSGHLDPAELVTRLEGYERAGVRALPADLQQALLRLPHEVDHEVIARAGRLGSEAGATLARWLKNRPEPVVRVEWRGYELRARVQLEPTGLDLVDALLSDLADSRHGESMAYWRLVLPSDRDVVAAHMVPHLLNTWERPSAFPEFVAGLFPQDGPAGDGLAALLGVLLAERTWQHSPERGQELLLRAAAAGSLPAAECGRQLGLALRTSEFKLSHVRASLEECARQGAHREVWKIMTGLLAAYLPGQGERTHSGHTQAPGRRRTVPVRVLQVQS